MFAPVVLLSINVPVIFCSLPDFLRDCVNGHPTGVGGWGGGRGWCPRNPYAAYAAIIHVLGDIRLLGGRTPRIPSKGLHYLYVLGYHLSHCSGPGLLGVNLTWIQKFSQG